MNTISIKTTIGTFDIVSEFTGKRNPHWKQDKGTHNRLDIVFHTTDGYHASSSFDFYGSEIQPELLKDDLKEAFSMIISECLSFIQNDYENFCYEFGYDAYQDCGECEVYESRRVYDACHSLYDSFASLTWHMNDEELCDLLNELNEEN